jgi:uncharacterized protein
VIAIVSHSEGAILSIVAQPGSKRNAVLGERAEALRIAVTAPPDKGKANAAIQSVLAETLGCKTAQVVLISGATSRQKRFLIRGIDPEALRKRVDSVLMPIANRDQPAGNAEQSDQ